MLARASAAPKAHMEDANLILLFGCTGTGKTSFANIASGSNMEVGKGMRSSTKHLGASKVFHVDNQPVVIVDCPGFNDTYLTETEILRRLAEFLIKAYSNEYKIAGLLYMHKISDTRVGGASFRHMKMFKALCGSDALRNVIYVTNMWSDPPTQDERLREEELRLTNEFFGEPLTRGARVAAHYNTPESAHDIIRMLLGSGHIVTKLQHQLVDDKVPLEETEVGLIIGKDLADDLLKQRQEMGRLKSEKEGAMAANDKSWVRQIETQQESARIKEQRLADQLQALKASKTNQLGNANQQFRAAQVKLIDTNASLLRAHMEAKINELAQNAKLRDSRLDTSWERRDWDARRNTENDNVVAKMKEDASAHSQHCAEHHKAITDRFMGAGHVVFHGIGSLFRTVSESLSTCTMPLEGDRRVKEHPPPARKPSKEDVKNSYGASCPPRSGNPHTSSMGGRPRQSDSGLRAYLSDGGRRIGNGVGVSKTILRKPSPVHKARGGSSRRHSLPDYKCQYNTE